MAICRRAHAGGGSPADQPVISVESAERPEALAPPVVIEDEAALAAFTTEWRAFAARHSTSPFAQPAWLLPWYRRYAREGRPRVLTWRAGGRLVGVAPLIECRGRHLGTSELSFFAGFGPALRGMVDVVAHDMHRPAVEAGLLTWLDGASWDVLNALRLPSGSTTSARLAETADAAGWRTVSLTGVVRSTTYVLDLPADEAGWATAIGPKARHNLRTEERRFARVGGRYERTADPAAADEAVSAIRRLTLDRWGEREANFRPDPVFEPFLVEALGTMLAEGTLYLDVARDASGVRACLATMALNRRAVALVIGVSTEPDVRSLSLGKHLFDASIGEAVRRGCLTYDFLWAGGYKQVFWHAEPRTLESLIVGRRARGVAVAEMARIRRRILPSLLGRGAGGSPRSAPRRAPEDAR